MTSRIAAAVLTTLVACGLVHGQAEPPPPSVPAVSPEPAATAPAVVADAPTCCDDWGCGDCGSHTVGPNGRFWAEGELLYWWIKGATVPALATTGPVTTPPAQVGILGQSGTVNLFGGNDLNTEPRVGARLTIGGWIDCEQTLGVEANGLFMGDKITTFQAGSPNGGPVIARPFMDANTGLASSQLVSFPSVANGSITIHDQTDGLIGAGVLARENLFNGCGWRIDVLGGYRYLRFGDRLSITVNQTNLGLTTPAAIPIGATLNIQDRFDAVNEFHGFDVGLDGEYRTGPWRFKWLAKVAAGENFETIAINGATTVTNPGGTPTKFVGGLLATPSNIGTLGRDFGSVVPELGLQVGCQLTRHVRAWLGYSLLYLNDAVYAGRQIDTTVNTNLLAPNNPAQPVGPFRPAAVMQTTSLWAEGIDLGLEIRY
jgi:hypothetical protein